MGPLNIRSSAQEKSGSSPEWNQKFVYIVQEHQGNMFKFCLSVYHGLQRIGSVNHALCLDLDVWQTPGQLELKVRNATGVVGSLELEIVLRQVYTGLPESPRSAVPAVPAERAEPEVHTSRAAQLEKIFLSATSRRPVTIRHLEQKPDLLGRDDPRKNLNYLQASRVKSSGSATLKT